MEKRIRERIEERASRGEVSVVVPKDGRPSRIYGFDKYAKMKNLPARTKPWTHRGTHRRQPERTVPDPLGAVEGSVHTRLRRREIYSEDEI